MKKCNFLSNALLGKTVLYVGLGVVCSALIIKAVHSSITISQLGWDVAVMLAAVCIYLACWFTNTAEEEKSHGFSVNLLALIGAWTIALVQTPFHCAYCEGIPMYIALIWLCALTGFIYLLIKFYRKMKEESTIKNPISALVFFLVIIIPLYVPAVISLTDGRWQIDDAIACGSLLLAAWTYINAAKFGYTVKLKMKNKTKLWQILKIKCTIF